MPYRVDASGYSPHGSWRANGTGRDRRRPPALRRDLRGPAGGCAPPTSRRLQPAVLQARRPRAVAERCWPTSAAARPRIDAHQGGDSAAGHGRPHRRRPGTARPGLRRPVRRRAQPAGPGPAAGRRDAGQAGRRWRARAPASAHALDGVVKAEFAGGRDDHRRPARQRPGARQPRAPGAAGAGQRRAVPHRPGAHGADAGRLLGRRRGQAAVGPADGRRAQPWPARSTRSARWRGTIADPQARGDATIAGGPVHRQPRPD